jgi:hypothetical protein
MAFSLPLEAGGWRLEAGGWGGGWRLVWRLEAGGWGGGWRADAEGSRARFEVG